MLDRRPPSAARRLPTSRLRVVAAVCLAVLAACSTASAPPPAPAAPALGAAASASPAVEPTLADHTLVDRVVALVDEEAILLSDVERAIALGLVEARPGESPEELRQRVLDGLVEQRLRFQAADRFGFIEVSVERIEEAVERIAANFDDRPAFLARLREVGLTEAELRQLVARQLMVLNFVDQRLGARVFVALDDIRTYYDEELAPRLRAQGETPPPLQDVREEIRSLLKEQRLNEEIERWTEELRREADVQLFLDDPADHLPPVVDRLDAAPTADRSQR